MVRSALRRAITLAVACSPAIPLAAQSVQLGDVEFHTSATNASAQEHFLTGLLFLYSFEYSSAAGHFRAAQADDPEFAMAYWGEAMTHNHPLWKQQELDAARAILARLAPTREGRASISMTDLEGGFLEAVEELYGEGTKSERDTAYSRVLANLAARYPDDADVQSFYALSLLGLSNGDRVISTYMKAGALALDVFDRNPTHPGAVHYIIHSFDDPEHAPLGLNAARAYSQIAPDAAHAQHMTSHIFVAMGMWDDVVSANINATSREEPLPETGQARFPCGHYGIWLQYGYQQQGRLEDARQLLAECAVFVNVRGIERLRRSLAYQTSIYVFDSEAWTDVLAMRSENTDAMDSAARVSSAFTYGFAAAKRNEVEVARTELQALRDAVDQDSESRAIREVMIHELQAIIEHAAGDTEAAIAHATAAVELMDRQPVQFGPPPSVKPPYELLGEILLEAGRTAEAASAFETGLIHTPGRRLTSMGLERARM